MNRFKTSKYKNTTPKIPKKDGWIANVRGGSFSSQGNHIKSSCSLVAFNTDQAGGGMVGLSSVNAGSDGKWTVTQISCHADLVTDLDFSPFDEYLLATCSADETVKLWRVCDPDQDQPSNAEVTLSPGDGRLEVVLFHPGASGLLAVASTRAIQVWDVTRDSALTVLEQHADQLQGLAWKEDGSLLASSCKDKKLRLFDPRAQPSAVQCVQGHQANRDSRVLWVKNDNLLTTGFNQRSLKELVGETEGFLSVSSQSWSLFVEVCLYAVILMAEVQWRVHRRSLESLNTHLSWSDLISSSQSDNGFSVWQQNPPHKEKPLMRRARSSGVKLSDILTFSTCQHLHREQLTLRFTPKNKGSSDPFSTKMVPMKLDA
ncbi:unnamed protein product [Leuciscus chuanchicus]